MLRLRRGESGLLLGARFLLVLLAPFVIGHAVDDLARFGIAERDALLLGRGAVPFRQAVAAEAGEVHQIDVLHIGAFAQMRDQRAERRRFELGAGLVFHLPTSSCVLYVAPPAAILNALLQWLSLDGRRGRARPRPPRRPTPERGERAAHRPQTDDARLSRCDRARRRRFARPRPLCPYRR